MAKSIERAIPSGGCALSSLHSQPLIAATYDLEEAGGFRFLILELVEGETIEERLKRDPIPLDDALQMATQIAECLAAAHERASSVAI